MMASLAASPAERIARLRLIRSANVGPISWRQLIARFGSAEAALAALPNLLRNSGGHRFSLAPEAAIAGEMAAIARLGARHVMLGDADYPALLAETESAPPVLTVMGDIALTARPTIAVVGARNASAAACRFARELAYALAESSIAVVSGMARGIDAAAHQGSLAGGAIAAIAGGIDSVYPPEHDELQRAVAAQGLLLAETAPGHEPRASDFPRRNRIIAGLALGTVVVEAAPRSGSLITARLAGEMGREVMAVPGSPLDPRSQGCNQLIRDGATLIQSADDAREAISGFATGNFKTARHRPPSRLLDSADVGFVAESVAEAGADEHARVEALLGMNFVSIDELVRQSGLAAPLVAGALLELELTGRLERGAGARVRLC